MITITHTQADGTVLTGSSRGDGVFEIVSKHGFRYSSRVGIYIRGSRDQDAQRWRIDPAVAALRDRGFAVTVDIDDTWRPAADREADRHDRAADRAERLDERAGLAEVRRDTREAVARRTLDGIPMGQPMLVDHHSYGADRNRRERAWANQDKARDEDRYAGHLSGRATAVRAHDTARDNPRVIMRRIERLQAELRQWQRALDDPDISDRSRDTAKQRAERLGEDIRHQQGKLDHLAATDQFLAWGPDTLAKGDAVNVSGHGWYLVARVNRKSVSLISNDWPRTAPFDKIFGRRRDGLQQDTPNGEPWPETTAIAVARWARHLRGAIVVRYDAAAQLHAAYVGQAQRLVHGLPMTAGDPEVRAFTPDLDDPNTLAGRRRLAVAYLGVFDRLMAGDTASDIGASITVDPWEPAWRMPTGEPVDRHPQDLHVGDTVAGIWERGRTGRELWRSFAGPVGAVSDVEHRRERGSWVTVSLADGAEREFKTHEWLAVPCCCPAC